MSTNLPTRSSSRAGRFKKKLVPEAFLEKEAPVIEVKMASALASFLADEITAQEFTALYVLTVLSHRYPGTWLGAKCPEICAEGHQLSIPLDKIKVHWEANIQRRVADLSTIGDLFNCFAFKSTPLAVNRSVLNWSLGRYGLELMFRIPRPHEVLFQQKQGRRCVTVVLEKNRANKFILGERDALGFTMHDLIHADHFYYNNQSYQGQLGFYGFLDSCLSLGHFDELLKFEAFEAEFEYLIADMNAYAVHLMKCFKSALIHYHPESETFFTNWVKKLNVSQAEETAWLSLNSNLYQEEHDGILLNFLARFENATCRIEKV